MNEQQTTTIKSSTRPTSVIIKGRSDEIIGERNLIIGDKWINGNEHYFWNGTYWITNC